MNTHKNARLTAHGRALLVRHIVEHGLRPVEAAHAAGVSARTAYKWLRRYKEEGWPGLLERSSRPRRCPHRLSEATRERIVTLRRERRILSRDQRRARNLYCHGGARASARWTCLLYTSPSPRD